MSTPTTNRPNVANLTKIPFTEAIPDVSWYRHTSWAEGEFKRFRHAHTMSQNIEDFEFFSEATPAPEQAKHTAASPLPWKAIDDSCTEGSVRINIESKSGHNAATLYNDESLREEMEANACLICTAVNAHQELVEACRDAEHALLGLKNQCSDSEWNEGWRDLPETLNKLTALLSKLGEKETKK